MDLGESVSRILDIYDGWKASGNSFPCLLLLLHNKIHFSSPFQRYDHRKRVSSQKPRFIPLLRKLNKSPKNILNALGIFSASFSVFFSTQASLFWIPDLYAWIAAAWNNTNATAFWFFPAALLNGTLIEEELWSSLFFGKRGVTYQKERDGDEIGKGNERECKRRRRE